MNYLIADETIKNLGNLEHGKVYNFEYKITNISDTTLNLIPWASCGCTTPTLDIYKLSPGATATLKAAFDTMGKSGLNDKMVGLWYNDGVFENKRFDLRFTANVSSAN
jgi:hypothetical protein